MASSDPDVVADGDITALPGIFETTSDATTARSGTTSSDVSMKQWARRPSPRALYARIGGRL